MTKTIPDDIAMQALKHATSSTLSMTVFLEFFEKGREAGVQAALAAIIEAAPPINAELRINGSTGEPVEDRGMAGYVEGFHDAWAAASSCGNDGHE